MHPERGALAGGGQLRGLKMRECELWDRAPLPREVAQPGHQCHDALFDDGQRFGHLQDLAIVGDVRRGGAEVDDGFRRRRLETIRVDVRHHIVTDLALTLFGVLVVDVLSVRFQLGNLLIGDRQPELLLRLGQSNPEPSPGSEFEIGREKVRHLSGGIPLRQRIGRRITFHVRIITVS